MTITKENVRPFIDAMNRTLEKLTYSGKSVRFEQSGNLLTLNIGATRKGYYNCLSHSKVTIPLDVMTVETNVESLDEIENRIMCNFVFAGDVDVQIFAASQNQYMELAITQWSIDYSTDMRVDEITSIRTNCVTIAEKSQEEEV